MTGQVVANRVPSTSDAQTARLAFVAIQYREEFGAVLRQRREQLGLTQAQVADRVERSLRERGKREPGKPFNAQNVSRWERGKNLGTIDNQEAVAAALETTMGDLVAQIQKPQAAPAGNSNGDGATLAELSEKVDQVLRQQEVMLRMLQLRRRTDRTRPTVPPETADQTAPPRSKRAGNRRAAGA